MTMKALRKHAAGFSLIEVMVVLVIIGIMATIGIPAYQRYTYAARQSEAHTMLRDILTAEKTELLKTGAFKAMTGLPSSAGSTCAPGTTDLSWAADNCPGLKYQYTVFVNGAAVVAVAATPGVPAIVAVAATTPTKFYATARAFVKKYDRNPSTSTTIGLDTWVIDELGNMYQWCDEVKVSAAAGTGCIALKTTYAEFATVIGTMTPAFK